MTKFEIIEKKQFKEINIKEDLPDKAYCYHCTKDNEFFLRKEKHNEFIQGQKLEFFTFTPYCNICGNECYIFNIDKYNKKVAKNIYNNKPNETKTEISF